MNRHVRPYHADIVLYAYFFRITFGGIYILSEGKKFEQDFKESIPDYCWYKRLNDNAASWANGTNTRFASTNECDYLLFNDHTHTLLALELKTTQGTLTYWREDFSDNNIKRKYQIKKNQILGLQNWSQNHDIVCGFIFNFRHKDNRTFFVHINNFLKYTSTLSKKSINIQDVEQMNPIEINNIKKRTHFRYNIDDFLKSICK